MCGIFGLFGDVLPTGQEGAALQALAHRGPDGASVHRIADNRILGHARLAIVDLDDKANQPMSGLDGRLVIVCNGEIYNARELRRLIADYPWTTDHSDTETILAAYWKWGRDFVGHLRGMFAFSLWDAAEQSLLLAVDRFSIKPLLLHRSPGRLAFASTASALAALGVELRPNERAVHSWLADGVNDTGEETFFESITQLPPATLAVWRNGTFETSRYWQQPAPAPEAVAQDSIEQWLDDALDSHMLSDVPIGINLSSGVDSNLLRLMSKRAGHDLHSFSFGFPGTPYDEPARVRPIVPETEPWSVSNVAPRELWRDLVPATRIMEMPLGGVAIYGHYRNAMTARQRGFKVVLAGEGSDEIFGGYRYYVEAAIKDLLKSNEADKARALFDAFAEREPGAWSTALLADQPETDATVLKAPDGTRLDEGFLTDSFAGSEKLPPVPRYEGNPVRALMSRDLNNTKVPKLLRWQDRAYMAHGVEVRVPFLDHVLVENMAGVPVDQLFDGGYTKAPLRRMAERMIPESYFRQPKLYVATPQREWLKTDLRAEVDEWLDPAACLVSAGYVDLDRLRNAYHAYCEDPALGNSFFIWKYIALEALFQGLFGGNRSTAPQ